MDNIVDLAAYRKQKNIPGPEPISAVLVATTDRDHLLLCDDGSLRKFEQGEERVEVSQRLATREEQALVNHCFFLEARISELLHEHAPHLINDDYITVPYADWDEIARLKGGDFAQWNAGFKDHPEAILARRLYHVLAAARKKAIQINIKVKIRIEVLESVTVGKIITSNVAPMLLLFEDPEALDTGVIKAHFRASKPNAQKSHPQKGYFELDFEKNDDLRNQFVARLMCVTDMPSMLQMVKTMVDMLHGKLELYPNEE